MSAIGLMGVNRLVVAGMLMSTFGLLLFEQIGDSVQIAGLAVGVATLTGPTVPLIMRRFGADPAQSSAIFLIMITDGAAFSVLLGLTAALL